MQPWIDAHCHLTSRFHPEPLPAVLARLAQAYCRGFVLGGVDPEDWQQQLAIPDEPLRIIRIFGLHPWTVQARSQQQLDQDFLQLKQSLPQAHGLGECGLDYFRCKSPEQRKKQIEWFAAQLELAVEQDKPCILHIVRAHHEALRMMKAYQGKLRGLVHSFWANQETAASWLDLGFILSLHPRILKGDGHNLLKQLPLDRVVFESDSPEILRDGGVTDPRLALTIMQHAALVRGEDLNLTISRQNNILCQVFPALSI
jgi:TatD DNase family protein